MQPLQRIWNLRDNYRYLGGVGSPTRIERKVRLKLEAGCGTARRLPRPWHWQQPALCPLPLPLPGPSSRPDQPLASPQTRCQELALPSRPDLTHHGCCCPPRAGPQTAPVSQTGLMPEATALRDCLLPGPSGIGPPASRLNTRAARASASLKPPPATRRGTSGRGLRNGNVPRPPCRWAR